MLLIHCTVLCSLFLVSIAVKNLSDERRILSKILDEYDAEIRPVGENGTGPVVVEINTYIRTLNNIDDEKMVFDVQLTFRQEWIDDRLRYISKDLEYISLRKPELIWTPDLFFINEESGHFHNILKPNVLARIFPNGKIFYSTRVSLKLFCPMNLAKYPLDSQYCNIKVASYAYTTQDISFVWKNINPVMVNKNILDDYKPVFKLISYDTDTCHAKTNTGEYSCLKIDLHLSRNFFYFLVKIYMPTAAMVLLSWLVFWMHPKYSGIRFGISIGALICSVLVTSSISYRTPQLSCATAMDVWIGVCFCFCFWSIFECCLVVNIFSKNGKMSSEEIIDEKFSILLEDTGKTNKHGKFTANPLKWLNRYTTSAPRIDVFSRFLSPVAFAFFILFYWLSYK